MCIRVGGEDQFEGIAPTGESGAPWSSVVSFGLERKVEPWLSGRLVVLARRPGFPSSVVVLVIALSVCECCWYGYCGWLWVLLSLGVLLFMTRLCWLLLLIVLL